MTKNDLPYKPSIAQIHAAAISMIRSMFAKHEIPVADDIFEKYLATAEATLLAANDVRPAPTVSERLECVNTLANLIRDPSITIEGAVKLLAGYLATAREEGAKEERERLEQMRLDSRADLLGKF